jgi:hypothetical protein
MMISVTLHHHIRYSAADGQVQPGGADGESQGDIHTHIHTHTHTHTHTHPHRNSASSGPRRRRMTPTSSCRPWRPSSGRRRRANTHSPTSDAGRKWREQLLARMTRIQVHACTTSSLPHVMCRRGTPYLVSFLFLFLAC